MPAGWRRRLLVPRRRCYATVRQVPPKRAAGGALGVCREVIFVAHFGRGEVTPTVSLVGPSPECGRPAFRDEIGLSTTSGGAFTGVRVDRLCAAIATTKTR